MKFKSTYKGEQIVHLSYSAFFKWGISNGLFVTKNGKAQFSVQTTALTFLQKDNTKIYLCKA